MAHQARLTAVVGIAVFALGSGCGNDEKSQRDCRMPFPEYDAGPEVGGISREAVVTSCLRRPNVTYVYGTCHATSDTGCSPPVEIQTWSYCHRKPHRGTPTDFGVRRGPVTIVIFARNARLGKQAETQLRKAKPADPSLPLTRKLRGCGAR